MLNEFIKNKILGFKLEDIRFQSFYMDDKLIEMYNVLFMKLGDAWYHITVYEMEIIIRDWDTPVLSTTQEINDSFMYPIFSFESSIEIRGRKIIQVKEVFNKNYGISFRFEDFVQLDYFEDKNENSTIEVSIVSDDLIM